MTFFRVKKTELKGVAKEVTGKDIVKNLLKYCWPRGRSSEERAVKCSLVTSLLLMVASKVRTSDMSQLVWVRKHLSRVLVLLNIFVLLKF